MESGRVYRRYLFDQYIFPHIGDRPIAEIEAAEVLQILKPLEQADRVNHAHVIKQLCGRVFRYAIVTSRAKHDVTAYLRGAIRPKRVKHHPTILDRDKIGKLLVDLESYPGYYPVICALKIMPLVFVREKELIWAEWSEIDFENALWRIPAARMKRRKQHLVPLATQVIAILKELHNFSGNGKYLFPSARLEGKPIQKSTMLAAFSKKSLRKRNPIKWILDMEQLVVGTNAGEIRIQGSDMDSPLTPQTTGHRRQSSYGSGDVQAILLGSSAMFVSRTGTGVYTLDYQDFGYRFRAAPLNLLAPEVTAAGVVAVGEDGTLEHPALRPQAYVVAGLPYTAEIVPLRPNYALGGGGQAVFSRKRVVGLRLRVLGSIMGQVRTEGGTEGSGGGVGGTSGGGHGPWQTLAAWPAGGGGDSPPPCQSRVVRVTLAGNTGDDGSVRIRQALPLPLYVVAIEYDIEQ